MKFLRRMKGCGLRDGYHNDVVRNELGMESVLERIRIHRKQGNRRGHMVRVLNTSNAVYTTRKKSC